MEVLDHWSNAVAIQFNLFCGPAGLLLNGLLIACIRNHTPITMKTYSTLIMFRTVVDFLSSFFSIMASNRLFPSPTALCIMLRGPCTLFFAGEIRAKFCFYWYEMQVNGYVLSHFILLMSFFYRIRVGYLSNDSFNKYNLNVFCFAFGLLFLFYSNWVYFVSLVPMETVNVHFREEHPLFLNSSWVYYGVINLQVPSVRTIHYLSNSISWVVIAISLISWYLIGENLSKFQSAQQMTKSHFSLMRVLLCQTLVAVFNALSVVLYVSVGYFDKASRPFTENMLGVPVVLQSVVSPFVTMLFISQYRKAVARLLSSNTHFVVRIITPRSNASV